MLKYAYSIKILYFAYLFFVFDMISIVNVGHMYIFILVLFSCFVRWCRLCTSLKIKVSILF